MMNKDYLIHENERLDDLGRDGLMLIQDPRYFCFGIDAVLLSSFAKIKSGDKVLDLCTGNGIIPVLLSGKTKAKEIVGLEIQKALVEMAQRSVEYNEIGDRVSFIHANLCEIEKSVLKNSFNAVTVNPPYMARESGLTNDSEPFYIARHEALCSLEDVIRAASYALTPKGRFFMVHRPLRLVDIFTSMRKYNLEPKTMRFVMPYENKEPNLVLIEGIKEGNPEIRVQPPLVVYNYDGTYKDEIMEIYGYE